MLNKCGGLIVMLFIVFMSASITGANCYMPSDKTTAQSNERNVKECTKSIEEDPSDFDYLMIRGYSYAYLAKYQEAIKDFSTFISLAPDDSRGYLFRGEAYEKIGELNSAMNDYKKLEAMGYPSIEEKIFRINNGREMNVEEKCSYSLHNLMNENAANPKESEPYIDLAHHYGFGCYGTGKDVKKGLMYFNKAVELDKTSIASEDLASFYDEDLKDYDKAIFYYRKALQIGIFVKGIHTLNPEGIQRRINTLLEETKHAGYRQLRESFEKRQISWESKISTNSDGSTNILYKDLSATFGDINTLATLQQVKLPKYLSDQLAKRSHKIKLATLSDSSFFIWFYKDVLGGSDPVRATGVLAYFDKLVKDKRFNDIDNSIKEYSKFVKK